jgi:hypothetical protein
MTELRHRETDPVVEMDTVIYLYPDGHTWASPEYVKSSSWKEMDDVVVDNFHDRIAQGDVINNPCNFRAHTQVVSELSASFRQWQTATPSEVIVLESGNMTARQMLISAPYLWDVNTATSPTLDTASDAKAKALANVDSTPYEFFEDLLEIRETLRFLENPISGLLGVARAFKRKRRKLDFIKDARKKAKAFADLWNQYRFAFAPLIRSIMTGMEAFEKFQDIERHTRRNAHGYSSSTRNRTDELSSKVGGAGTEYRYYWTKDCMRSVTSHASILYEVSNPLVDVPFALGLRLKDIPVVMWEIFPLSFLLDRLWNVKNLLSGLLNIADPTVTLLSGSLTDRTTAQHTITLWGMVHSYNFTQFRIDVPDYVEITDFYYDREIWNVEWEDIIPPLTPENVISDVTKLTDLLALTISRLL